MANTRALSAIRSGIWPDAVGGLAGRRLVDAAKGKARGRTTVRSIEELDEALAEADEASAVDHDAGMFLRFSLRLLYLISASRPWSFSVKLNTEP